VTPSRARLLAAALFGAGVGITSVEPLRRALPEDMVWRLRPGAVYMIVLREPAGAAPTDVRLLRVDDDGLHHPLPWLRVLDGPRTGDRLHVRRAELRQPAATNHWGLSVAAALSLLLALAGGATLWALLTVQQSRSTAPRHAE
jgi:hypothetical protein